MDARMTSAPTQRSRNGDDLLRAGRSLRLLAITVIALLSVGILVLALSDWLQGGQLAKIILAQGEAAYGFVLLMLLTVGYLVGKNVSTSREQKLMMVQLLDEESVSRARRLDPILEYHHPELCREILRRQSHYAGRIHSAVSMVEMSIEDFQKLAYREDARAVVDEFYQALRQECRPLDFWVRWSPNSFLLVLLDVSADEAAGVVYRLRTRMEQWWRHQSAAPFVPHVEWRYRTVGSLGASGDILREVQGFMDPAQFVATSMEGVWQAKADSSAPAPLQVESRGRGRQ